MATNIHVRPAQVNDIDILLALIKDLAIYEKSPESAQATPELLRKNIFEPGNVAFALIAEVDNQAVGFAIYFFNFSTWTGKPGLYLEDLYVKPEARKSGVGKALFAELGRAAQAKGCPRMDWVVLKWNTPARDFYLKRLGAVAMEEWEGIRLDEEGIARLAN